MRIARTVLILLGLSGLVAGALLLLGTQTIPQILGLAVWLLGAIVVHDLVLAPFVFGSNLVLRRYGRRVPAVVLAILQVAAVVGSVLTILVVPAIYAQSLAPTNPTILVGDYALRLLVSEAVLAGVTAAVIVIYLRRRRQKLRPLRSQA